MNMYNRIDAGFSGCTMRVCNKQHTFSREYASRAVLGTLLQCTHPRSKNNYAPSFRYASAQKAESNSWTPLSPSSDY
jgi:hypothetical protein